ncbi:MAG: VOC family protein [Bacteroidia bacterium]|nr:VOC family protein [Bacteroidia bacterium]
MKLRKAAPVLASLDMFKTLEFYTQKLGFKQSYGDEGYGIVVRDEIMIHFWKCEDKIFPENTSCYIYVEDVDSLYEEMSQVGVIHPNGPLKDHPHGMREFAILDNFGNLIRFGQEIIKS